MSNTAEGSVFDAGTPDATSEAGAVIAAAGDWTDSLDPETRTHLTEVKGYKSPADLANAYVNLERTIGMDKVPLPAKDAPYSDWEGWEKLGTPAAADGYDLKAPDGYENYDAGLGGWFRQAALEAKVPAPMAARLHDAFVERSMEAEKIAAVDAERQIMDTTKALKGEYGSAFDERISAAKRALREYGGEDADDMLADPNLSSNPAWIKMLVKVGMELGSGRQFKGAEDSGQFGMTPASAREEIAKIRSHDGFMNISHPEHKVLQERLTALHMIAFPESA